MFLCYTGITVSFSNRVSPGHSSIGLRGRWRKKGTGKKQMLCTAWSPADLTDRTAGACATASSYKEHTDHLRLPLYHSSEMLKLTFFSPTKLIKILHNTLKFNKISLCFVDNYLTVGNLQMSALPWLKWMLDPLYYLLFFYKAISQDIHSCMWDDSSGKNFISIPLKN